MKESLGARLRQERESKQIPLASIASSTKIKMEWLDGLENDDVSKWPSGIFRRAFVKSYAQAIGLQPDPIVREFLALYPDPAEVERTVAPQEASAPRTMSGLGMSLVRDATALKPPSGSTAWIADRLNAAIRTASSERLQLFKAESNDPPVFAVPPSSSAPLPAEDQAQDTPAVPPQPDSCPDYQAAADLCTSLATVVETDEVFPLLERLAALLDSTGVVVWLTDHTGSTLTPVLWWGYSDAVIARLGRVRSTSENATAAAYRSRQPQLVTPQLESCGAIAVPLTTPGGCVGVLAAEVRPGSTRTDWAYAFARIFAAQLAMLVAVPQCEAQAVGA
jgi:hypothetical protein